jgi:hypothetical protein
VNRQVVDQLEKAARPYRVSSRAVADLGPREHAAVVAAVRSLEKETGVQVAAPELPDFADRESVLDAGVRVLGLKSAAAASADWYAAHAVANEAVAWADAAANELEALSLEWRGLVHQAVRKREAVPEIPAALLERAMRAQAIANLWGVGGDSSAFSSVVRGTQSREETMMQALGEDEWIALTVYAAAIEGTLSKRGRESHARAGVDQARRIIDRAGRQSRVAKIAAWAVRELRPGPILPAVASGRR